jgi:hypothetical protein
MQKDDHLSPGLLHRRGQFEQGKMQVLRQADLRDLDLRPILPSEKKGHQNPPPNPPLIKGGRGDFWQGRGSGEILAAGCGYANLRIIPQKRMITYFSNKAQNSIERGFREPLLMFLGKGWEEIESFPKKIPS